MLKMKRKSEASAIRLWAMVKIRGAGGVKHRLPYLAIPAAKRFPRLPSTCSTDGELI
jgi:hypothetical protein